MLLAQDGRTNVWLPAGAGLRDFLPNGSRVDTPRPDIKNLEQMVPMFRREYA